MRYYIAALRRAAETATFQTVSGARYRQRSWAWVVADAVAGVLAVGALDLLLDAF
jgi:hypothetical protein